MSSATTRSEHLTSPDGKWIWDGVAQEWRPKPSEPEPPAPPPPPIAPAPPPPTPAAARLAEERLSPRLARGLSSFGGEVRSEDLAYGQTVLVWARWILIGTGLLLSFWSPKDLGTLQVQLAAIIALAFGNFYLHVQLLRGHPALDTVVYAASVADITVVTALVLVQTGYPSPVFVFYFAAMVGISVAFPTWLTAGFTAIVVGVYGIICVATAPAEDLPAIFTRLLMIAAVAVCGNLFARSESRRRADAIRIHSELLDEAQQEATDAGSARQSTTGGKVDVQPA